MAIWPVIRPRTEILGASVRIRGPEHGRLATWNALICLGAKKIWGCTQY
jgi:hypothetical protein